MNTTDALNASLILLHENTSLTPQDTDEDEVKILGIGTVMLMVALQIVAMTLGGVAVFLWFKRRERKRFNRTTKATAVCDKETELSPFSGSLSENTPDLVGCASKHLITDVSRTGPYGKEDTPILAIAGTDKYSSNSIGSGSASEFDDELHTEIGYPNRKVFSSNNECRLSIVLEQCYDSSIESVSFDESNLVLNDQLIHATERFGDGCSDSIEQIEECIEYVKHVKSPVGEDGEDPDETCPKILEQTKPQDIDYNLLDWNSVFIYLAQRIEPLQWRLFFNVLYGKVPYQGRADVSVKLGQVEHDIKQRMGSCDTVSHFIEQFKAWKQFAGRSAKHTMIDKTLEDLQWNDKLDEFRTYIRNPPLLSPNCDQLQNQLMLDTSLKGSLPSVISLPLSSCTVIENDVNDQRNIHHSRGFQSYGKVSYKCEMSYELDSKQPNSESVNHDRNDPDGVSAILEDSVNCGRNVKEDELQTTYSTSEQNIGVKETLDKACSSNIQKRSKLLSGNIKGKGINFNTKRTKKKYKNIGEQENKHFLVQSSAKTRSIYYLVLLYSQAN